MLGGGAKSRLWNEIMRSVYGRPVKVHSFSGKATSIGAAIAAGVSIGIFDSFEEAARIIRPISAFTSRFQARWRPIKATTGYIT